MQHDKTSPDTTTPDVEAQQDELQLVRVIQQGFPSYAQEAPTGLLIKRLGESRKTFEARRKMPVLNDGLTPAIDEHVARILETPPNIQASEAFMSLTSNIDAMGTPLLPYLNDVLTDAAWTGHTLVLVDHSSVDNEVDNRAQELAAGARPYWVSYEKDQVRNTQWDIVRGVQTLTRITLKETVRHADGFGSKDVGQWRTLRLRTEGASWQLYQKIKDKIVAITEETLFLGANSTPFQEIPLVPLYTNQTGFWQSRPLFIQLARLIQYSYNLAADKDIAHAKIIYQTLIGKGMQQEELDGLELSEGVALSDFNQDLEWKGANISTIQMTQDIEEKLREQMKSVGVRSLHVDRNRPDRPVGEVERMDESVDQRDAQQVGSILEAGLTKAIQYTEFYLSGRMEGKLTFQANRSTTEPVPNTISEPDEATEQVKETE